MNNNLNELEELKIKMLEIEVNNLKKHIEKLQIQVNQKEAKINKIKNYVSSKNLKQNLDNIIESPAPSEIVNSGLFNTKSFQN